MSIYISERTVHLSVYYCNCLTKISHDNNHVIFFRENGKLANIGKFSEKKNCKKKFRDFFEKISEIYFLGVS